MLALLPALWLLPAHAADVTVGAAASLIHALPEIAQAFESRTGHRLRVSYAASGNLARQILQGAPFEVFLSANADHVRRLEQSGHALREGQVFAQGRLVAYFPRPDGPRDLDALAAALRSGQIRRLAIANPETAPYGAAAREILQSIGVPQPAVGKLIIGENVAQTAQFAATGAVDAALIALSLVRSPKFPGRGSHFVVSSDRHAPIRQSLVLLRGASEAARAFAAFLTGPEAGRILERYGFETKANGAESGAPFASNRATPRSVRRTAIHVPVASGSHIPVLTRRLTERRMARFAIGRHPSPDDIKY